MKLIARLTDPRPSLLYKLHEEMTVTTLQGEEPIPQLDGLFLACSFLPLLLSSICQMWGITCQMKYSVTKKWVNGMRGITFVDSSARITDITEKLDDKDHQTRQLSLSLEQKHNSLGPRGTCFRNSQTLVRISQMLTTAQYFIRARWATYIPMSEWNIFTHDNIELVYIRYPWAPGTFYSARTTFHNVRTHIPRVALSNKNKTKEN